MCGDIIFLIELLKKNKFKNLLIIVQIVISVFYLTFFLIPITEAIDTERYFNEKIKYEKRYCIF